ncbi:MAG: adenosylcobinamide-GDP ribazoletransferase, partial [Novosphingobium sp.]
HGDRARLSAVMADPHVGSFAVVAISLQLLAKLVLLHALPPAQWPALVMVPVLARIAPIGWTLFLPPLHTGLGSRFREGVIPLHLIGWSLAAMLAAVLTSPALLALFVAVPLWGWWLRAKLGGISGDGHGAGIELVETALLLALVVVP